MIVKRVEKINDGYKFWFDYSILIIAHILLLPFWIILWIIIPVLIWVDDRGPIFYRQQRMGRNRKLFNVLKFRTMVVNADTMGPSWTTAEDPRVTRIGRILRKTALDELPEVINIWKRDMSLVGPRALYVGEQTLLEEQIQGFEHRLVVSPGLTGLAQIYDTRDIAEDKFYYDMQYIESMTPWLDVCLLVVSVKNTLLSRWDDRSGKASA